MKIAFDLTPLESGHKVRGVGVYTKYLFEHLQVSGSPHRVIGFSRSKPLKESVDLIHYPYFDPFFLTLPLIKPNPVIVTIHDLIPLVFPQHFPPGIRGKVKWQIQKLSLLGVRRILTDSQSSKEDITRMVKFDPTRIDVIYLAPGPAFHKSRDSSAFGKYHIKPPYIIYIGDLNWNKNITGLLEAFKKLKEIYPHLTLFVVGRAFTSCIKEAVDLRKHISTLDVTQSVVMAGYVEDGDLASLISQADVLVEPSWYEGFGLPVLEGLSCGTPAVVGDNSSLREVGGPAKRCDPGDPESIARAVSSVLGLNGKERKDLVQKGLDFASSFSWKKAALETLASYEKVFSR